MNFADVLRSFPRPGSGADFKFRVSLGFFDPQTRFFQPTIPNDVFTFFTEALASKPIKGVLVDTIPVMHAYHGFEKFGHIVATMWDVRIDYVQSERQGIFLNSGTKTIVAICNLEFLERMQSAFEEFLSTQTEVGSAWDDISGAKIDCKIVVAS
jgi:hypothetical protein